MKLKTGMKLKLIIAGLISSIAFTGAVAQVEYDDMYFNSKDRAKLKEAQKTEALAIASNKKQRDDDEEFNPTDSYSARNVNPEYTSRSESRTAQGDEEDYYISNYQSTRNNLNDWNNNFNNWYGNSWYRPNYWGPSIYSWNSPYYGFSDPYYSPWYDPYWSYNGWSSSFSFHYGNSWNYGWGGNYNYWNRPYWGGNGYYDPYYGSNVFWNNYRYPQTIVVVNNGESGKTVVNGKRPTRGGAIGSQNNAGNRSRGSSIIGSDRGDVSGGRISNNGRTQTEYYNRSWRNNNSSTPTRTYDSRSNTQQNRSSNWNSSSWSNSNNTQSQPSYSPSRSSGSNSGTRSHSSSSGSGSNGRTRGGN